MFSSQRLLMSPTTFVNELTMYFMQSLVAFLYLANEIFIVRHFFLVLYIYSFLLVTHIAAQSTITIGPISATYVAIGFL